MAVNSAGNNNQSIFPKNIREQLANPPKDLKEQIKASYEDTPADYNEMLKAAGQFQSASEIKISDIGGQKTIQGVPVEEFRKQFGDGALTDFEALQELIKKEDGQSLDYDN